MNEEQVSYHLIQEFRRSSFALLGMAYSNYRNTILARQGLERRILERKEKTMAEVKEIIIKVEELANDSVKIANFAEQLVKNNSKLASSLEFMLGVELQEKARREEDAR